MMMWSMVFLKGLEAKQLAKLDLLMLNLLFEFSIEYDINHIIQGRAKEKLKAPPPEDVMKELGYR